MGWFADGSYERVIECLSCVAKIYPVLGKSETTWCLDVYREMDWYNAIVVAVLTGTADTNLVVRQGLQKNGLFEMISISVVGGLK